LKMFRFPAGNGPDKLKAIEETVSLFCRPTVIEIGENLGAILVLSALNKLLRSEMFH
jgi:hypothetical protein